MAETYQLDFERAAEGDEENIVRRRLELFATRSDGSLFSIELTIAPLRLQDTSVFAAFIRDISDRKHMESLQLGQNQILNMVVTGAPLSDTLKEIARFAESLSNYAIHSILQVKATEAALFTPIAPSLPQDDAARLSKIVTIPSDCSDHHELLIISNRDSGLHNSSTYCDTAHAYGLKACAWWPIVGKHNNLLGTFTLYFREARKPDAQETQLARICTHLAGLAIDNRASEEKIRYLAHYDNLTSLPNRFLFREYFDLALKSAKRHSKKFAVFFVDLDKFKEINDTLGHDVGDKVLRVIAQRLRNCLRHTDKIARMGGDEFYVLIEELNNGSHAAEVARKLLKEAARPVHVGKAECHISISIGISIYPEDGCDEQTLLKNADNAMYHAKRGGKNAYRFFSPQAAQIPSNFARS